MKTTTKAVWQVQYQPLFGRNRWLMYDNFKTLKAAEKMVNGRVKKTTKMRIVKITTVQTFEAVEDSGE